ncbi:MAG TPA: helix-turn-helix domain-containing protein [Acidimicrobiales bacterium]|nr:helix-turn-helix domain-containing protein [Acidimicrobiales bacterium]
MPLSPSPAVVRAADVLRHLASDPTQRFTVSQLARRIGVPRATCDTLLLGLAAGGFVRRDPARRYELGPACIVVGDAARAANPALTAAAQHAEVLAREQQGVAAVSIRVSEETRIAGVFDYAPALALRVRVGEAIRLVPPFGAVYIAWDDEDGVDQWLRRADPPLTQAELSYYRSALQVIRRDGFSATHVPPRQASALEHLTDDNRQTVRRARDKAAGRLAHSEYLVAQLERADTVRIAQISAPVFEPDGAIGAAIMMLGPAHDLTAADVRTLGDRVANAAIAATRDIRGITP